LAQEPGSSVILVSLLSQRCPPQVFATALMDTSHRSAQSNSDALEGTESLSSATPQLESTDRTSEVYITSFGGGSRVVVQANAQDTVTFLRQAAATLLGKAPSQLKLICGGEVLENNASVSGVIGKELVAVINSEIVAWSNEGEIGTFPVSLGTLEELDIVGSSFTLMASVWRNSSAPDTGGQYVSDQAIFAMDEYDNTGELTNIHFLVRDGMYGAHFYRNSMNGMSGPRAAKEAWEDVAFVLDKDAGETYLYVNGERVCSAKNPPLDANPGNRHQLKLGQYAYGRKWKGKMKNIKVLKNAWSP